MVTGTNVFSLLAWGLVHFQPQDLNNDRLPPIFSSRAQRLLSNG